MKLNSEVCERARISRDPRFDGLFFIGVKSTGIYCRPVCKVRLPLAKNIDFYPSAAAAAEAGFRPCLRCRPETAPGTPAWSGTRAVVNRALRLIGEGVLDTCSVEKLADRLGMTDRHLRRLFMEHLGASPKAIAQTRRMHFAKSLLDTSALSIIDIALASGYGSVRRFNDHFKNSYGKSPRELRGKKCLEKSEELTFNLGYRPPYNWKFIIDFLSKRAIPGIEWVCDEAYLRVFQLDGELGWLQVEHRREHNKLVCRVSFPKVTSLGLIKEKVKRIFDIDANPAEITHSLSKESGMNKMLDDCGYLPVPGCWDPFEVSIRAIIGQLVSVSGAMTTMKKLVREYGEKVDVDLPKNNPGLLVQGQDVYLFPKAEVLCDIDYQRVPLSRAKIAAIEGLAKAVVDGSIQFDLSVDPEELLKRLLGITGIGPWTAGYIALRALNDPDAFLSGDLVVRQVVTDIERKSSLIAIKDLEIFSEQWRPWRAYALMQLWNRANG
jgi:AraC family transcriptional regulator of adaptative response / DNA-3-methyladenine glycosylase II